MSQNYHYNAQGYVTAVTDSNGNVYRQYVYDPYGNIISVKDGIGNAINIGNDQGFNNAYTYRGYRLLLNLLPMLNNQQKKRPPNVGISVGRHLLHDDITQDTDVAGNGPASYWVRIPEYPDSESGGIRTRNRKHPDSVPEESGHLSVSCVVNYGVL